MWLFYAVAFPTVVAAVGYLLYVMPAPKTPWHIKVDVGLAWLAAMSSLVLVPVDVGNAYSGITTQDLRLWWLIIYWYSFIVQVLVLPFHSDYVSSCEFTVWDRIVYTARSNFTFYGLAAVGGIVGLFILKVTHTTTPQAILGYLIALSNAYGLIASGLLMGYGLVAIPRGVWRASDVRGQRRMLCGKAGRQAAKMASAYKEACDTARLVERVSGMFHRRDPLRKYVDKIMEMLRTQGSSINPTMGDGVNDDVELDYLTRQELATLRRKLVYSMDAYEREKAGYMATVHQFIKVEEVVTNMDMSGGRFVPSRESGEGGGKGGCCGALEWWWKCRVRKWLLRLVSVLLWLASLAVVLSEATISDKMPINLSAFAWVLRQIKDDNLLLQLSTFVFLAYPCIATYYALYKAGRFSFYLLVPGHTSSNSLCSNALFMTRFASPLAFNFIYAMAMPKADNGPDIRDTVFFQEIGSHINNAPVFGVQFTTWVPMLLLPYILLCTLNVPNSLIGLCMSGGKRGTLDDDWLDSAADYESNGQRLLRMEYESHGRGGGVGGTVALVTGQGRSATSLQSLSPDQNQRKKGWRLWGRSSSPDASDSSLQRLVDGGARSKLSTPLLSNDNSRVNTPESTPVPSLTHMLRPATPPSSIGWGSRGATITSASPTSGLCFFKKGLKSEGFSRGTDDLMQAPSVIQYINVESDEETDDPTSGASAIKGMFNKLRWGKK